jgi:guanylate cyclase
VAVSIPIVGAAIALVAMKLDAGNFPGVMHVVAAATLCATGPMIVLYGGVYETAGNTAWAVLTVVGAVAIFADRRAHFWLAAFVIVTVGASLMASRLGPTYVLPDPEYTVLFNTIVVCAFIYVVLYYFVRQSTLLYRQSERLLRNVLPDEIAERLKRSDEMIADEFESASILFADVAGFTPLAARMQPGDVVDLLNEVFSVFDTMISERGLEKIKTIGDAYMVASGVPIPRADHAVAICDLALEMQARLAAQEFGGRRLEMRIGIASGPVMAGIIGRQKFSYDLWGDTVNLASRMETTGTPGMIQLAPSTCELVTDVFICDERGVVEVKGKGPMRTWYLKGRRDA